MRISLKNFLGFGAKTIGGIGAVAFLAGIFVVWMTPRQPTETVVAAARQGPQTAALPPLAVSGGQLTHDRFDAQWYSGMVVNNTGKQYGFVRISYDLYDANGQHLGIAVASTSALSPYGRWLFKAGIDERCTDVRLAKLEGW